MKIHILGVFPRLFETYFNESLFLKAQNKNLIEFFYHDLRDHAQGNYRSIDDKVYGGGDGMVMMPHVVCDAVRAIKNQQGQNIKVVLTSPAGRLLTPAVAKELASHEHVLFLCGRYEGVDERAIQAVVDDEISIGDYVITGGELASTVIIDAMSRYLPGFVGKEGSVQQDSHENGLLEHPQYTRPETFEGVGIPPVLLSGHHAEITKWRRLESIRRTWERRPDLLKRARLTPEEIDYIKNLIHNSKKD